MSTALAIPVPAPMQVRELLEGLLGRDVTVAMAPPLVPNAINPVTVGVYVTDHLEVTAVSCADQAFSVRAAAAVGLVPASQAEDALGAGTLDDTLRDNLYEILNIAASLFNVGEHTHVKLHAMHPVGLPTPPDALVRTLTLGRRLDLKVDIAGYGGGRLSFVGTPG
ncbi:hypothetical protein D9V37_13765 [Nocardioides mangrovicus]|uniref:Chemotaxis phosphatase CheX-like domain-containing protein n=1 Tax=Nocardioides mangrovicus TaxID=2478913 RepID=A0A3L8P0Y3_9ACTN|nr:hypothetical protein [Nocardioides mangrovicus]RLV48784.1 hypothetical protein D9V37_13765 [Nocardioides mangrovicus]